MRRPRRHGRGRDGFLLAEALSALALGALILVALLSLGGLLRRTADRAAWGVEVAEVSTRTVDTIARELRQIARRRWPAPPAPPGARQAARSRSTDAPQGSRQSQNPAARAQAMNAAGASPEQSQAGEPEAPPRPFVFSGAPDRLTFALTPRQPNGLRAPVFVAWQIDEAGGVLRAEAALKPDAMTPAAIQLGPVVRIDPGPERLRFAYVDRQSSGAEIVLDGWPDPMRMPVAIRIDRFDAATGQPVGSLRVPLLIDAEPGCAAQKGQCSRAAGGGAPTADGAAAGRSDPQAGGAEPSGEQQ